MTQNIANCNKRFRTSIFAAKKIIISLCYFARDIVIDFFLMTKQFKNLLYEMRITT